MFDITKLLKTVSPRIVYLLIQMSTWNNLHHCTHLHLHLLLLLQFLRSPPYQTTSSLSLALSLPSSTKISLHWLGVNNLRCCCNFRIGSMYLFLFGAWLKSHPRSSWFESRFENCKLKEKQNKFCQLSGHDFARNTNKKCWQSLASDPDHGSHT